MRGIVLGRPRGRGRGGSSPGEPVRATSTSRTAASRARSSTPARCRSRSTSCRWSGCSAAGAEGETVVRGAGELRLKESDRIATVVDGLRGLGADIEATEDGFVVRGGGGLRGGTLDALGDHRLAMMGAVAGLALARGRLCARDGRRRGLLYPGSFVDLQTLGSRLAHADRDRRARRGRQVDRRARARPRARLHLPRQRRHVSLRRALLLAARAGREPRGARVRAEHRAQPVELRRGRRSAGAALRRTTTSAAIRTPPEVSAAALGAGRGLPSVRGAAARSSAR